MGGVWGKWFELVEWVEWVELIKGVKEGESALRGAILMPPKS